MAGMTRRQLEELRTIVSSVGACPECADLFFIGAPGLFVHLEIPHHDSTQPGTHRKGTEEEFERYFDGCPTCGEQLETKPIVMPGLIAAGVRGRRAIPNPWPVNEWPPISVDKPGWQASGGI